MRVLVGGLMLLTGSLAGAPLAAGDMPAGFKEVGQLARVRYFAPAESRPGRRERDAVRRTDEYLARLEVRLGQRLAQPIEYLRHERPEDIAVRVGVYATGLTRIGDDVVHSTLDFHPHELVHAVAGHLGNPGRMFHEGLAVAIGDEGRWGGHGVHEMARAYAQGQSWRSLNTVFDRLHPDVAYPLAGSFVLQLIENEGEQRLISFFRECGSDPVKAPVAFRTVYGYSLEQAVARWQRRVLDRERPGTQSMPVLVAALD